MAKPRRLMRAPIAEALVDIRVAQPAEFDVKTLLGAHGPSLFHFPIKEEKRAQHAWMQFSGEGPPAAGARDLGIQGISFKSEDLLSIAQFRLDGFTFNRLRPYTSWEEILPQSLDLWQLYAEVAPPLEILRIAVRYINRMRLPLDFVRFEDFIETMPRVPATIPPSLSAFVSSVVTSDQKHRVSATISQTVDPLVRGKQAEYVLDIDAYSTAPQTGQIESIKETLERLRAYKNEIFFGSITERLAEMFE